MAKKKLILNESTTRQFMKYANIKPSYVSNFLREAEEMEDEMEMAEEPAEEMEVEMEPEMDAGMETEDEMEMSGGDIEGDLMDLMQTIASWAKEKGINMQVEGDEEEEEMEEPEGGDMGASTDLSDADADLEAADVEVEEPAASEEEVIAEVTRRVARRLLRESAKQKRR